MFGLYDMTGNAWQWVEDCWHPQFYVGAPSNGKAWLDSDNGDCSEHMYKGGDWYNDVKYLRSANRNYFHSTDNLYNGGFRVARSLEPKT